MNTDSHPNIRSRTIRTLIRCPVCDKPIGERLGNQWWFAKYGRGEAGMVPVVMDQRTQYGSYRIGCPDKNCPGGHIFAWVNESISIKERVAVKTS